ncbi:MAG: type II secretion system protein GspK, partial [Kiritimatiellia bacterium]|nr:type II secretion system protein GspK [Kiritimatiellia bacterium]
AAGIAYGQMLLMRSGESNAFEETDEGREAMRQAALRLRRGLGARPSPLTVGDAQVQIEFLPEEGRRNINHMTEEDWELVFAVGRVPQELWPEMIDALFDWTDGNDLRRLHGAESDDSFYQERGYKVKNAPLDSIEELLWIKGFERHFVLGGAGPDKEEDPYPGFAHLLTVWGDDNRVNINTAIRDVLLTLPGVLEETVDEIILLRAGLDGEKDTEDDGFQNVQDALAQIGIVDPAFQERVGVGGHRFVRLTSLAEVDGVRAGIWAILSLGERGVVPVYWREEPLP